MKLPSELQDAVIDYFHDDPTMLARCALVCRSWLPAARFHSWRSPCLQCTTDALKRISSALDTSPDVAYYVCDVVVTQKKSHVCTWDDLQLLGALLALLARLPNLANLTLDGLWFGAPTASDDSTHDVMGHIFPSVQSVTINTCSFDAFDDVRNLCSAFPALRVVRFDGVWWGRWLLTAPGTRRVDARGEQRGKRVLEWNELDLGSCFSRDVIIEWLLDSLAQDSVRRLRLPLIGAYDRRLKDLLERVGPCLQHLDIGSPSTSATRVHDNDGAPRAVETLLDLSACASLQTITLGVPTYRDAAFVTRWLVALLLQIASPCLEEVRFAVYPILRGDAADASSMLAAFDWSLITRVLLGDRPTTIPSLANSHYTSARMDNPTRMRPGLRFVSLRKVTFCAGRAADYVQIPSEFVSLAPYIRKVAATSFGPLEKRGITVCFEDGHRC